MKFSIRDLMLVTVIVALVLGWGMDRWRLNQRVVKSQQELKESQGETFAARFAFHYAKEEIKWLKSLAPDPNPPKK